MSPAQIISVVAAIIVSSTIVVFTINENTMKNGNNNSSDGNGRGRVLSFSDILDELKITQ